ncbi:Phosphocarrier protein HPr [uncultured Roseburia sp.]|uniref:HPr family phosphocarrier protein n=1 Tax=Brotonthovivens ammoniilytica TaxID=2981725 RepID=A0ABT2TLE2_9FIRM|nr:HPr family phosphocarrier protein [Brotonthovivens ammoniilytica]MCU6763018.1 HPr family phosphocarrier protein [Brotonthovivens ammoniilytica]SCJ00619.1 Phosphocarrier protein HPr [uncultured Roseburia sp.]
MREFKYVITDSQGIHARPAGEFVKAAKGFASSISVTKGEKKVNAKNILGLMGLGVKKGEEILVQAEGEDEESAAAALQNFLKENL